MGEDSLRISGLSAGLAVILNGEDSKENLPKTRLISCCDDSTHQSMERTLEYVFGLPNRSLNPLSSPVDSKIICFIIRNNFLRFKPKLGDLFCERDEICIIENDCGREVVGLKEYSICGDIRIIKPPLLIESLAMFSSVRANACVWKGKWIYEVMLETSGVGDGDDSYAYDGRRVSKWNKEPKTHGQSWVVGDVIGCCIDLDRDEVLFFRNGNSLGMAFHGIQKMGPGFGYYPVISFSQGERCELNFGAQPFKYSVEGYLPLQGPPSKCYFVTHLL